NSKADEATQHVDGKVTEFNQTVADNGFLSPEMLGGKLEELDWQKYKVTKDDGYTLYDSNFKLDFNNVEQLASLGVGTRYLAAPINAPTEATSNNGSLTKFDRGSIKYLEFRPYNSSQIFIKRFYNTWSEWERVDNTQTDTGWVPYSTINGVGKNVVYKNSGDNGFDCGYRIIKDGNVTRRILRVNVNNLTQGVIFAELPSSFSKHTQVMSVRTPRDLNGGLVEIKPDGKLIFQYYKTSRDWASTDYAYGEFSWVE